ncbi:MAG: sigma-70 family RNA polymerase sigma factor [Anaeromyxobacteraceae bacterium]|nr:sigma-70 family RNA polymerase sigma factor [Anaeromyxobacteraceae bacterium]
MSTDAEVRALLEGGDARAAATAALRALAPDLLRFLRSLLRDEALAGEAFSVAAEHLWRGLPAFEWRSSLRTWALRLAINAAANVRDDAWRRKGRPFATGEASALAAELQTRTVLRDERHRQALLALRAELTPDEQALLALRLDQGLGWSEVAAVLAAEGGEAPSPATLMKRFERLKERLGKLARERGLLEPPSR